MRHPPSLRWISTISLFALLCATLALRTPSVALASDTPAPTTVTLVGSLQSEAGCSGDWDPLCVASHLTYDAADDVWQGSFALPEGSYDYKVALNGGWDENYGAGAVRDGGNIALSVPAGGATVKFYYDHKSHWVTSNRTSVIAVAPGSFQSELGCPGDWQPDCLRSWLQDIDGDGIYTYETTSIPAGSYEGKVALNEGWDTNYGQGGAPGGANIAFTVPADGAKVVFRYDSVSHVITISAGHSLDGNIEWDGLRHDSRDTLYRTPSGAVPAGSSVQIRFRTYHNDVSAVTLRLYDINAGGQRLVPMSPAATDVPCFEVALAAERCDFWSATVMSAQANNFWYRFIVSDGTATAFYGDNTSALDGGLGKVTSNPVDQSFALMFYTPTFKVQEWAKNGVIYQIFPDRFRNGDVKNDPKTGQERYDDPMLRLAWGTLPEGYCRNYADAATNCPWRFDTTPPDWSPTKEGPRGRDYMGGDLQGVLDKLGYLQSQGVTIIYFNPIFDARSNHRYDTADYMRIDRNLGNVTLFKKLVKEAEKRGIKIVLDGVFNHMSSDSAAFDRYGHYSTVGACESATSVYRSWFNFRAPAGAEPAPCAPTTIGGADTYYNGWFGFDSIPELRKSDPALQRFFLTNNNSVGRIWIDRGAAGWRLDVMGDASFPAGYWETFRQRVLDEDKNAIIYGELWQKDSTLLKNLRGETADTTMNYRLRDAILGLLTPGAFDSKGFGDSGRQIAPSEFASRMLSVREDYPDAAYYTLMNLIDSHDTERALWTLTPGADTRADKELNAANLADGKRRLMIASLIQFTMPGSPTVYYGDEVGVTGDDDPDDRRTFPWDDAGGGADWTMASYYKSLASARKRDRAALVDGDIKFLLTDDAANTVAYGRKGKNRASIVAINRSSAAQTLTIPAAGYLPEGFSLTTRVLVGGSAIGAPAVVSGGALTVAVPALGAVLLSGSGDLTPPSRPGGVTWTPGNGRVDLTWASVSGAVGYNVYRSILPGGGYVKVNAAPLTATMTSDTGLRNARTYYYVVKSLDSAGNESAASAEAAVTPFLTIDYANLQWPYTIVHTISATNRTPTIYGQVYIAGVTNTPGATDALRAQIGYGPRGSAPDASWIWADATFNTDSGNNDEFAATLLPESVGEYDYVYRYSGGGAWVYGQKDGLHPASAYSADQAGQLSVVASGDTVAPTTPTGLRITTESPAGVGLAWDAVIGDASLYGYEIYRSDSASGPSTKVGTVIGTSFTDATVSEGATYYYAVRAIDTSLNRSPLSASIAATAALRTITLTINVTVPTPTGAAVGRSVYIAGFLDRLDGGLPQWNPGGVSLTKVNDTRWTITFTGKEGTQIEYKYALGAWDYVEKDVPCGEVANRQLTLAYGSDGNQTVNDTIDNWRNVAPCGN